MSNDLEISINGDSPNNQGKGNQPEKDENVKSVQTEVEVSEEEVQEYGELVVGLDIGSTKICCVVGEFRGEAIEVLGVGIAPSHGLRKGIVVNIESTVASIREAVRLAEEDSGYELTGLEVYVGIAGNHIRGFNSPGIIGVNREIRPSDMSAVIDAAKMVKIPENQQIIHVLPQEFMVDEQVGIQNPVGMTGVRLATNVHIVTADVAAVHNLVTCCRQAGLEVAELVLESIASSSAVVSRDEMEMGVALIDIGGGTSDLAVLKGGSIRHTAQVSLGGSNLTSDISVCLHTPIQDAENLKELYGGAISSVVKPSHVVPVPMVGEQDPKQVTQKMLVEILEARTKEILDIMKSELEESGYQQKINGGIILTGGTALLHNIDRLAEQIYSLPVRIGVPVGLTGRSEMLNDPRCTTAAGLLIYAKKRQNEVARPEGGLFARIKEWFRSIL